LLSFSQSLLTLNVAAKRLAMTAKQKKIAQFVALTNLLVATANTSENSPTNVTDKAKALAGLTDETTPPSLSGNNMPKKDSTVYVSFEHTPTSVENHIISYIIKKITAKVE